jgi:hypothetical protein
VGGGGVADGSILGDKRKWANVVLFAPGHHALHDDAAATIAALRARRLRFKHWLQVVACQT